MAAISLSTNDIKKSVLRHCGEVDNGTSFYDTNGQVMDYINKAHVAILSGGNEFNVELSKAWSWAVIPFPAVIVLQPPFSNAGGGVTVTSMSNKIVFSTAPSISLAGYWLQVTDRSDYMRINTHQAHSVNATIDGPYADSSGSGLDFRAILVDYKLAPQPNGILRLTKAMVVYRAQELQGDEEQKIYYADENQMERDFPMRRTTDGTPVFFAVNQKDPNGVYTVRFNRSPTLLTRVEYKYIPIPAPLLDSTTNFPIIPVEHRDCLDFAASYFLCLDKNDDRAQEYLALTEQKLKAMQKAEEKQKTQASKYRGKLIARGDDYQRASRFAVQETS